VGGSLQSPESTLHGGPQKTTTTTTTEKTGTLAKSKIAEKAELVHLSNVLNQENLWFIKGGPLKGGVNIFLFSK